MSESAGQKTEKATPKKRKDARDKGQVLKSTEVVVALSLILLFAVLWMIGPSIARQSGDMMYYHLSGQSMGARVTLEAADVPLLLGNIFLQFGKIVAPLLIAAVAVGLLANMVQVGFLFSSQALMPKGDRLNPLKGFKRMFSGRTIYELLKSLIKVTIIVFIVYGKYRDTLSVFPNLSSGGLTAVSSELWGLLMGTAMQICLSLVIVAAADYAYQWWQFEKEMRMTKYEVKTEFKQQEGDPQIKGQIKQKQRQMAMMRMMQAVPEADVVITNPTHFAVALKYDPKQAGAPVVLAKGQDFMAQRIKKIAREHSIETVENRPLAQALYHHCEIGAQIPIELYGAVADILAYVYKIRNKMSEHP